MPDTPNPNPDPKPANAPDPREVTRSIVREALEKQAARRPPTSAPREMPVTPMLPRVRKRSRGPKRPR